MSNGAQFPSLLMIIRHGEKPGDPSNDKDGGPNLSVLGSARAAALPSLFTPDTAAPNMQELTCDLTVSELGQFTGTYGSSQLDESPARFPGPDFLFATSPGDSNSPGDSSSPSDSSSSSRPLETITPLAQALQFYYRNPMLTINSNFTNDSNGMSGLASEILNKPNIYGGRVVLICWHHGTIPQLTSEYFKVPASQLPFTDWPATRFDFIFCITWTAGQANLAVNYQLLLHGDKASLETKLTPPDPN